MAIGIQSGGLLHHSLPFISNGGVRTPAVQVLPPAAQVAAYVRSGGPAVGDDEDVKRRLVTTLAAALPLVRSGRGDTIVVLPGHSENVSDATMLANLVAGTRIVGVGVPHQNDAPTFTWNATAAQWTVDQSNVEISGLRLDLSKANGVVKAINITGAGCSLVGNHITVASGAALKATIAVEVGTGASHCRILANHFMGTETHNVTDGIKVVGTDAHMLIIALNTMLFSATAGNGNVHITSAVKRLLIQQNVMYNTHTASTACIAVDNVAADGILSENYLATVNNGSAAAQGIVFTGTGSTVRCFHNRSSDEPRASGVLAPAAAT